MKFDVLGREVDVQWNHIFVILAVYISLAIFFTILGFVYAISASSLFNSQGFSDAFIDFLGVQVPVVSIISYPLIAYLLLFISDQLFRLKKDVALCRSLAGAECIIGMFLWLLLIPISYYTGYYSSDIAYTLSSLFGSLISSVIGTVILYLWLLIFLKPDMLKIKKSLELALIFSASFFLVIEFIKVLVSYQSGNVYDFSLLFNNPFSFLSEIATLFMFGFVMLYHIQEKKIDIEEYLFAGFYLAPPLVAILLGYLFIFAMDGIPGSYIISLDSSNEIGLLVRRIVELALLAVLAKVKF